MSFPNPLEHFPSAKFSELCGLKPQINRENALNEVFQKIVLSKPDLKVFCKKFPCGGVNHEHFACHPRLLEEKAAQNKQYWSLSDQVFRSEGGVNCIPAEKLAMPLYAAARRNFMQAVTHIKFKQYGDANTAMQHFHRTFVATGSVNVDLWKGLAEYYVTAVNDNIHHLLVMVDLPYQAGEPDYFLPVPVDELTDEVLERFFTEIQERLTQDVAELKKVLIEQEGLATKEVQAIFENGRSEGKSIVGGVFGTDNQINISLQVEIGKAHSLVCEDSDLSRLLGRFAYDVARGMELERQCEFVRSINCVGPEHLVKSFELQEAVILDFFHRHYKGRIAYHAGELCNSLVPAAEMNKTARAVEKIGPQRIGHGTSLVSSPLPEKVECIEVCPSACKYLLGIDHPFVEFLKRKIPIVVSTDNMYVFDTTQGTEFYKLIKRYPDINYADVKEIARNSLHYSDLAGESILEKVEHNYTVKSLYAEFIALMGDVEMDETFKLLAPKQKVQIRHEIALIEFEDQLLASVNENRL